MTRAIPKNLDYVDPSIGKMIWIARTQTGMSKKEFGSYFGMSADELHECETGKRRLHVQELYAVSRFLNVRTDFFFIPLTDPEYIQKLLKGPPSNVLAFPKTD